MSTESQQNQQKKKMGRPRKYDEDFRKTTLERMKGCQDFTGLALELGINRCQLYRFQREALGRKPEPRPEAWLKEKAEERQRRASPSWNVWWRDRRWNWIFSKVPCCASRKIAGHRDRIPASRLRANPAR